MAIVGEQKKKWIVFGEVLWDVFGDEQTLGGAPLNFAYYANRLNNDREILFVSALGAGENGSIARREILAHGLNDRFIETLDLPTGRVDVQMQPDRTHSFIIHENVAWDAISPTNEQFAELADAELLYFGTLAQRSSRNRDTLVRLVHQNEGAMVVFDVNLRQHFYSATIIRGSMALAKLLKINEDEWEIFKSLLQLPRSEKMAYSALFAQYPIEYLCITKSEKGAVLITKDGEYVTKGRKIDIVDTVGCGDAFAAALSGALLDRVDPQMALEKAADLATKVAQNKGALLANLD